MISTFTALIDSNVFYGARLRSLFLSLAQTGIFRARWSNDIHREWIANLLEQRPDLNEEALRRTRQFMDQAVPDCLVTGYESLVGSFDLPDADDRHVVAAAVAGHASVIVTFNLQDFPDGILRPFGIHARHPDEFLLDVISIDEDACLEAIRIDLKHYIAPPLSVVEYIESLRRAGIQKTADFLSSVRVIF